MPQNLFYISVDTGGTFTDAIARDSEGKSYQSKVLSSSQLRGEILEWVNASTLRIQESWNCERDIFKGYQFQLLQTEHDPVQIISYQPQQQIMKLYRALSVPAGSDLPKSSFEISAGEEAPVLAARLITQTALEETLPIAEMRIGSTRGTNALLENKGAKTAFLVSQGFKDVLEIGYQQRPDIFALRVEKPLPLYKNVLEIQERLSAKGEVISSLSFPSEGQLQALRAQGIESIAIALLNAYQNPQHEQALKAYLEQQGFAYISASTDLSSLIKYIERAETAVVNAYLEPIIDEYLQHIQHSLSSEKVSPLLRVMTSAGSLLKADRFRAKDSLLSGPAGGVVGAAQMARQSGYERVISFDMGGTSTDAARFDQDFDYQYELKVGSAQIQSPTLYIETVASGGGSLCYYDGYKLQVGPESAGAFPGPACYGAGGDLTITDVNLLLGRLDASQFGIPVFPEAAEQKLAELLEQITQVSGEEQPKETILEGFLEIANEKMAGAIRKISLAKGYDPAEYALVAFGGAGGLHACRMAGLLQIQRVLVPAQAGLLSAYGISEAKTERFVEKQILSLLSNYFENLEADFKALSAQAIEQMQAEGLATAQIYIKQRLVNLRLQGQDHTLAIHFAAVDEIKENFQQAYQNLYGHQSENREIEIESIRVIASEKETNAHPESTKPESYSPEASHQLSAYVQGAWQSVPVYIREALAPGAAIEGFALLLDRYSTTVIEANWQLEIDAHQTAILKRKQTSQASKHTSQSPEVELELFTRRFMTIAENMGAMLQRTALSVNVKERLDFSCALLDAQGELIANAPHIPVHLGSLGVCVRSLLEQNIPMLPGDTIVCNHPKFGGSHLPDVTLITPVYTPKDKLVGYVVNRAHHAEIGGTRPGSMPPRAKNLAEEGVVIAPFALVKKGEAQWEQMRALLSQGAYPSRAIEENIADLNAALAANRHGEQALLALLATQGFEKVQHYMQELKKQASLKLQQAFSHYLKNQSQLVLEAEERLDDGSPLKVKITLEKDRAQFDFTGSAPTHSGNLNANKAIVYSVVVYVLRTMLREDIPLNDGLLAPVEIILPEKSILNPDFPDEPRDCPAVVGGNTETSQRLTDTLLKALGLVAGSQGTMNNVLFGNERFGYYETICGGCGAGADFDGASAVHHHMTNTRITDPEVLEHRYPVRLERFEIRADSGGQGKYRGGNGTIRELRFLEPVSLSVLTQHRAEAPYGLQGGEAGALGKQEIIRKAGSIEPLAGIDEAEMQAGDRLVIYTPGGGGFGN